MGCKLLINTTLCVAIILILWCMFYYPTEMFRSCNDCSGNPKVKQGVINPFVYPYSATSCLDLVYADESGGKGPLTHANTPDHVPPE